MQKRILVVTSTIGYGELIKQALVESGLYQVVLVNSAAEALGSVQEKAFSLAIVDSDLEDIPFPDLIRALGKVALDMRLVLIPPDNNAAESLPDGLKVSGFLSKPFYMPELFALVERLIGKPTISPAQKVTPPKEKPTTEGKLSSSPPAWLEDVSRAAQHLTAMSLGTSAQAALIVRDGKLWAYAGQLAQPASQELASMVANYWAQEREFPPGAHREYTKSDLARFTRLGSTGGEYMLYATSLGSGMILALAFDAETPFSKIRSQASQLARALSAPPTANGETLATSPQPEAVQTGSEKGAPQQSAPPRSAARKPVNDIPDLSENWLKFDKLAHELFTDEEEEAVEEESAPAAKVEAKQENSLLIPRQPAPVPQIVLEPVIPGMVNLVFACVIIPRLPQHLLTGNLVERLMEWIGQLCLAFAWRLEYISIAPEYIQWVVNVPPTTSPSYLMRILRHHTSQRIFAEFPELARENPSGEFWAPGYLIMSSQTPPPEHVIREFIQQIRQHQGASSPFLPRFER